MTKPTNLIYGVDEKPPAFITFILGLQHVFIIFIAIIFPVLIIRHMGDGIHPETARAFISFSMIAGGITTILQALKKGPVGSGYLCPAVCGPSYLSASMLAVKLGGLPLLFGMTGFVGVVEALFSRVMHKLRFLFPSEVTGLIVTMVGIVLVPISVRNLLGLSGDDTIIQAEEVGVAVITLALMVALNIYSKGKLRLYCILIGMTVSYSKKKNGDPPNKVKSGFKQSQ
jgi:NCS2 family nucleobase:cation symporter-2